MRIRIWNTALKVVIAQTFLLQVWWRQRYQKGAAYSCCNQDVPYHSTATWSTIRRMLFSNARYQHGCLMLSLWPMQYRRDTSMHSGSPAKVDILLTYLLTSPLWLLKIIGSDELSAALFCLPRRVPTGARILCTFLQHWVAMTTSLMEGQTWRAMPTRAEVFSKKHLKTKSQKRQSVSPYQ